MSKADWLKLRKRSSSMQKISTKVCGSALERLGFMMARDVPKFKEQHAIDAIQRGYSAWKKWSGDYEKKDLNI